jgi:predicted cobalt transporter CbtA
MVSLIQLYTIFLIITRHTVDGPQPASDQTIPLKEEFKGVSTIALMILYVIITQRTAFISIYYTGAPLNYVGK